VVLLGRGSGEGRLGLCAGGSAPFAEAGFRALSAPKVVALLGMAPCGRGDTTFQEGRYCHDPVVYQGIPLAISQNVRFVLSFLGRMAEWKSGTLQ
jgi:hypothetical protein